MTARNILLYADLARALWALNGAGVPALVVKGAAAGAFYPDPALRAYGDLDVLVPRAQVNQAEVALNRLGYRPPEAPTVRWGRITAFPGS
jgi:hypothetical protein